MEPLPVYTDFQGLAALRSATAGTADERLENAARQFSAVFAHMLLKSMRQASLGDGMFESQQTEFYRDIFDQQMALQLTQGEGLGIAKLLIDQFRSPADREASVQLGAYEDVKRWTDELQVSVPSVAKSSIQNAPHHGTTQ